MSNPTSEERDHARGAARGRAGRRPVHRRDRRQRTRAIFALAAGALSTGGCGGEPEPPPVDGAVQPLGHGAIDDSATYAVFVRSSSGALCTGALVTPRWVVTANHCITGHTGVGPAYPESTGGGVTGTYTITVVPAGADSTSDAAAQPFFHTGSDGDVIVMQDEQLDLLLHDGAEDPARDLALIRLSDRVPLSVARPVHVPLLGEPGCPKNSEFTGRIVGYSGDPERRSNVVEGFSRDQVDSWGAIYSNVYHLDVLPIDILLPPSVAAGAALIGWTNYRGIEPGDSGGPLVYSASGVRRLCGVASNAYITSYLDDVCYAVNVAHGLVVTPIPCVGIGNRFAAVDSPQALAFLEPHLVRTDNDGDAFFDGECPADPDSDADTDNDNLVNACDVCPLIPDEDDQSDADHDGVGDACDNCPAIWNANQANEDGDARGDVCDPCPEDKPLASSADVFGDADSDGVCNHEDNCPRAANASQRNTNRLSELVHAPRSVWGDACDPVPVPRIAVHAQSELLFAFDNDYMKGAVYDVTEDTFALTPLPPHPAPGVSFTGPLPAINKVPTHFRFCQPGPASTPPFCDDVAAIDDAQLRTDLNEASEETPDMPYHRMTIHEVSDGKRGWPAPYDYAPPAPLHRNQFTLRWDYRKDGAFWKDHGIVAFPCPDAPAEEAGACLKGLLWVHAETPVGDDVNPGTGLHGAELANSHTEVDVRHLDGSFATPPQPEHWFWYDLKWLPRWPDFEHVLLGRDVIRYTPLDDGLRGVVASEAAQRTLGDLGLRWLASVESGPSVGGDAPAAVALDVAQTAIASAVFVGASGQLEVAEEVQQAGNAIAARVATTTTTTMATAASAVAPPRNERAVALYSRFLRSVIVLGGPDSDPDTIWRSTSPTDNRWTAIRLRQPLGKVLAATVSFVDGKVYALDEIDDGRQRYGRLLRLDPERGEVEIAGRWPRRDAFARLALGLDEDGSILLTAASADAHVVLHLAAGGRTHRVIGRHDGRGAPVHPVFATRDGYVLHFDDGAPAQRLDSVDAVTDLTLDEVGRVL